MAAGSISSDDFRDAMARFASGVTVVTAFDRGTPVGFTATGFTSVSLAPPLVLVCVAKRASVHAAIVASRSFGVSILAERQAWIAEQFARSGDDRFRGVSLRDGGVPLVEGAVAQLVCLPHARHESGDHTIVVGEVVDARTDGERPLVHCVRRFGAFVADVGPRLATANAGVQPERS
jgi:flavin reductase ActVB